MSDKAPAFQFYPDKFIAGTEHLSDKAFRAYMRVLCHMWLHSFTQFSIKNDEKFIRKVTKLSKSGYTNAWNNEIMDEDHPLLKIEQDMIVSNGLRKEKTKQDRRSKSASDNATARWEKQERIKSAYAKRCPPSSSPSSSTTPSTNSKDMGDFNIFWEAYNKKTGKKECAKWWKDKRPSKDTVERMVIAIKIQEKSEKWMSGYKKDPIRWLRGAHWDDEESQTGSKSLIKMSDEEFEKRMETW